jgi:hypothetical protein
MAIYDIFKIYIIVLGGVLGVEKEKEKEKFPWLLWMSAPGYGGTDSICL